MKNTGFAFLLALLLEFGSAPSIYAHHGQAEYDLKSTLTLTGTVAELTLANPHSTLAFDVKDEKGDVTHWVCQFGVLRDLKAQGWANDTLKPGDVVKVAVHPKRNGDHGGTLVGEITYADGRALPLNPPKDQPAPRPLRW
jgi:hypothetical protein